jgi:hypothetical protein
MIEYRVTKYDPARRNANGAYLEDEWTSATDIGRAFRGVVLTDDAYQCVERAYICSALAFISEGGLSFLAVAGLKNHKALALGFGEGSVFPVDNLSEMIRRILREEFWCRLEGHGGFIHFGWDYYMYIGVPSRCPDAEKFAQEHGLFPEECASPYSQTQSKL